MDKLVMPALVISCWAIEYLEAGALWLDDIQRLEARAPVVEQRAVVVDIPVWHLECH